MKKTRRGREAAFSWCTVYVCMLHRNAACTGEASDNICRPNARVSFGTTQ